MVWKIMSHYYEIKIRTVLYYGCVIKVLISTHGWLVTKFCKQKYSALNPKKKKPQRECKKEWRNYYPNSL